MNDREGNTPDIDIHSDLVVQPDEIVVLEVDPEDVPWTGPATALGISVLIGAEQEDWALTCIQVMAAAVRAKGGRVILNQQLPVAVQHAEANGGTAKAGPSLSLTTDNEGAD